MRFWSRFLFENQFLQICLAEFFGTFLLVFFGDSGVAQKVFYGGDFLTINITWSVGLFVAIIVAGKPFGGHFNPAVTITSLITHGRRNFKWYVFLGVILHQILGGFFAASCVYFQYFDAFENARDSLNSTNFAIEFGGIFYTNPAPNLSLFNSFLVEFFASAVLLIGIYACIDPKNNLPIYTMPLVLLGIGQAFGWQTGYAINPARDLGPRLYAWLMFGTEQVFYSPTGDLYFYIPIVGSIAGGIVGAFLYIFMTGMSDQART